MCGLKEVFVPDLRKVEQTDTRVYGPLLSSSVFSLSKTSFPYSYILWLEIFKVKAKYGFYFC